jgi:type II secretory pathway component PulJ
MGKPGKPQRELPGLSFAETAQLAEMSREDRLELLLAFLGDDLEKLGERQRTERLRALFVVMKPRRVETDSGTITWEAPAPPTMEDASTERLRALQARLRDGVKSIASGAPTGWILSPPELAILGRGYYSVDTAREGRRSGSTVDWYWHASPLAMIEAGAADLVWQFSDRIRACGLATCRGLFLAVKRQEYCTPEHGQQARDQRKTDRKRKGAR